MAVDGIKGTDYFVHGCSLTTIDVHMPWWIVDLLSPHYVSSVVIVNRGDANDGM